MTRNDWIKIKAGHIRRSIGFKVILTWTVLFMLLELGAHIYARVAFPVWYDMEDKDLPVFYRHDPYSQLVYRQNL